MQQITYKHPSGQVGQNLPSRVLNIRSFTGYISDQYCLPCAYFSQVKGHFGRCRDRGDTKIYDGAKKDTACFGWRLKSEIRGHENGLNAPEPIVKIVRLRPDGYLGSLISTLKYKQLHPSLKYYPKINDYSYPKCPECGGESWRIGHGYHRVQRYRCKSCRKSWHVDKVIIPKPESMGPKRSQEYVVLPRLLKASEISKMKIFIRNMERERSAKRIQEAYMRQFQQWCIENRYSP